MRVAELGNRHDPAPCDVLTRRRTEARSAPDAGAASVVPYPEPRPGRGAERPHGRLHGEHAGARRRPRRTGFEPFLIAAVLGLILWALILAPFFI